MYTSVSAPPKGSFKIIFTPTPSTAAWPNLPASGGSITSSPGTSNLHRQQRKGPIHVFNYIDFPDANDKRYGAESDSDNINNTFGPRGYDIKLYKNYTLGQTLSKFEEIQKDLTLDALIVIILSHGTNRYSFMSSNGGIINLDNLR
ncbi:unnamed protein product, partial [Meganyctiphanes norvegica]